MKKGRKSLDLRWQYVREVNPNTPTDAVSLEPTLLLREAHAAAQETLQGGALTRSWLTLFQSHLSRTEPHLLRWAGDMAESAEIRRAYSGLYGRYFARALLSKHLNLTNFVPLQRHTTELHDGYEVRRIQNGDIPDWVAWDNNSKSYVFAEAKGLLSASTTDFLYGNPPSCVNAGKEQLNRVRLYDLSDSEVNTPGWVAATLWSTDCRQKAPISILWDPSTGGRNLSDNEKSIGFDGTRRTWVASIADFLGFPELKALDVAEQELQKEGVEVFAPAATDIFIKQLPREKIEYDARMTEPDTFSPADHQDTYLAAVASWRGVRPLRGPNTLDSAIEEQKEALENDEARILIGVSKRIASKSAVVDKPEWISDSGMVSENGMGIFDLRYIRLGARER